MPEEPRVGKTLGRPSDHFHRRYYVDPDLSARYCAYHHTYPWTSTSTCSLLVGTALVLNDPVRPAHNPHTHCHADDNPAHANRISRRTTGPVRLDPGRLLDGKAGTSTLNAVARNVDSRIDRARPTANHSRRPNNGIGRHVDRDDDGDDGNVSLPSWRPFSPAHQPVSQHRTNTTGC